MTSRIPFILIYFLHVCTTVCGQEANLSAKSAVFTAVEWKNDEPVVRFKGEWYEFKKIDGLTKNEILTFCKKTYSSKWKKRFSEDLLEVLISMGIEVQSKVELELKRKGKQTIHSGTFTVANRKKLKEYNDILKSKHDRTFKGYLTKKQVLEDLHNLETRIIKRSSYRGLNNYDINQELQKYRQNLGDSVLNMDFGLFLMKVVGQIGDRHSYVRNFGLPNTQFLPFIVAPFEGKVIALQYIKKDTVNAVLFSEFPFLTAIDGISIQDFIRQISFEEAKAPTEAFFSNGVKQLKYIEKNYAILKKKLPNEVSFTFGNETSDTTINMSLEHIRSRYITWDEKFARFYGQKGEELNNKILCHQLFRKETEDVAYARFPSMVAKKEAPIFFEEFNKFMYKAKDSEALIIDIRSNTGGTRDLILELAKFVVHPDSIHVGNIAQQRGSLPLSPRFKEELAHRTLFPKEEFDEIEQHHIEKFLKSFQPIYHLDTSKFSQPHFFVLNGSKIRNEGGYYYNKPIYIMINERCFSASSVLATVFKGLPNITLVGVKTDGSSGNSKSFYLPNSHIKIKLSTMVSFQKDGKILDGYGTEPDIELRPDLQQILWMGDYQLTLLKEMIDKNAGK